MKYLAHTLVAALICIALVGVYAYMVRAVASGVARAASARSGVETLNARDASLRATESFLSETAGERAQLATFVAKDADVAKGIELLEAVARARRVTITTNAVTVMSVGGWQRHEEVHVSLSAEGSFSALTAFAASLESLPIAARVMSASIEAKEKGWFGTFTVSLIKEKSP